MSGIFRHRHLKHGRQPFDASSDLTLDLLYNLRQCARIRCQEPISGTLVQESRFSVPDTFFFPRNESQVMLCKRFGCHAHGFVSLSQGFWKAGALHAHENVSMAPGTDPTRGGVRRGVSKTGVRTPAWKFTDFSVVTWKNLWKRNMDFFTDFTH